MRSTVCRIALSWSLVAAAACTGNISPDGVDQPGATGPNGEPVAGGKGTGAGTGTGTGTGGTPSTPGAPGTPAPGPFRPAPAGMRRLTVAQYVNAVHDLLGANLRIAVEDLDPDDRTYVFATVSSYQVVSSPNAVDGYRRVAFDVAGQAFADQAGRAKLVGCTPASATDPCVDRFLAAFGRRVFRRPLDPTETTRYKNVLGLATTAFGDPWAGLQFMVAGLLQDPNFLYVPMLGEPDPAQAGRLRYTSWEMASRLALSLLNTTPDDQLLDAAQRGELVVEDNVRQQALRLLGSARARDAAAQFFAEHYHYFDLELASKDPKAFPKYNATLARAMRGELDRTLGDLALDPQRDFTEVFDSKRTWLNRTLATYYGVQGGPAGDTFEATALPATMARAGLLTMAGLLTVNAHAVMTSPTRRGVFVRTRLLCQPVPPPPGNVDTNFKQDPNATGPVTMRVRLTAHRADPTCAGCHAFFDPIGLAFENFDAIGGYRTTDAGQAIDAKADLDGAAFEGALELGRLLKGDARARACLVRELYKNAAGQDAIDGVEGVLQGLGTRFDGSGHKLPDLLVALVTSPAFRLADKAVQQ
jgi:hypothetical protein